MTGTDFVALVAQALARMDEAEQEAQTLSDEWFPERTRRLAQERLRMVAWGRDVLDRHAPHRSADVVWCGLCQPLRYYEHCDDVRAVLTAWGVTE